MKRLKEKHSIQGIDLYLSQPVESSQKWIGQPEPLDQLLACWLTLSEKDYPLSPRIIGVPGMGKTTLAMAATKIRKQDIYIFQCTSDTRPEDLLITPVLGENNQIHYHASPLLTAMIRGDVVVLDEGNRMPEKSWASLASLLDDRKSVESVVAGIQIKAHKNFRFVVTMNDDASTYEIPDYIMSRLQPAIEITHPNEEDELNILRYNLPEAPEELLDICVGFLQEAHQLELSFSIRDGLHLIRYAQRLQQISKGTWKEKFQQAVKQILGEEALDPKKLAEKNKLHLETLTPRGSDFGEFFFGDENLPDDDPVR